MDERIRPLPAPVWRAILDHIILPRRSPASAAKYASIWTEAGSPLIVGCCALAAHVEQALHAGAAATEPWRDAAVRAAMVYGEPGVEAALRSCARRAADGSQCCRSIRSRRTPQPRRRSMPSHAGSSGWGGSRPSRRSRAMATMRGMWMPSPPRFVRRASTRQGTICCFRFMRCRFPMWMPATPIRSRSARRRARSPPVWGWMRVPGRFPTSHLRGRPSLDGSQHGAHGARARAARAAAPRGRLPGFCRGLPRDAL